MMKFVASLLILTLLPMTSFAGVYQCVVTGKPVNGQSQTIGHFEVEPAKLDQQGFSIESRNISFVCEGVAGKEDAAEVDLQCSINVLNNPNAGSVALTNDGAKSLILVTGLDNIIWAMGCFLK